MLLGVLQRTFASSSRSINFTSTANLQFRSLPHNATTPFRIRSRVSPSRWPQQHRSSFHTVHKARNEPEAPGNKSTKPNSGSPDLSQAFPTSLSLPTGLSDAVSGSSFFGAAFTALVGLGVVFVGGVIYVEWYKSHVLDKVSGFETRSGGRA